MDTLKQCPFCGNKDIQFDGDFKDHKGWAYCNGCKSRGPVVNLLSGNEKPEEMIIRAWNSRIYEVKTKKLV